MTSSFVLHHLFCLTSYDLDDIIWFGWHHLSWMTSSDLYTQLFCSKCNYARVNFFNFVQFQFSFHMLIRYRIAMARTTQFRIRKYVNQGNFFDHVLRPPIEPNHRNHSIQRSLESRMIYRLPVAGTCWLAEISTKTCHKQMNTSFSLVHPEWKLSHVGEMLPWILVYVGLMSCYLHIDLVQMKS